MSEEIFDLPGNRILSYNGHPVKWCIGDINSEMAKSLGLVEKNEEGWEVTRKQGFYWEAWGSFNGAMYQLFAWGQRIPGDNGQPSSWQIKNIRVLADKSNYYFNEENYNLLTGPANAA